MLTDHLALGIFNRSRILFQILRKEIGKAPLTNEANTRAVLFRCCLEVILGRQFTNFRFFELPNGKQAVIDRIMTHLMEKIALILCGIDTLEKRCLPVTLAFANVVSSCNFIGA